MRPVQRGGRTQPLHCLRLCDLLVCDSSGRCLLMPSPEPGQRNLRGGLLRSGVRQPWLQLLLQVLTQGLLRLLPRLLLSRQRHLQLRGRVASQRHLQYYRGMRPAHGPPRWFQDLPRLQYDLFLQPASQRRLMPVLIGGLSQRYLQLGAWLHHTWPGGRRLPDLPGLPCVSQI
jgi:hypothetical protein